MVSPSTSMRRQRPRSMLKSQLMKLISQNPKNSKIYSRILEDLSKEKGRRSKYGSQRTEVNGIWFDSKREARYYQGLLLAERTGGLLVHVRQVSFSLPGGVRYLCDFAELWRNGQVRFVDCKGFRTSLYRLKKKQVEALYPIKIVET